MAAAAAAAIRGSYGDILLNSLQIRHVTVILRGHTSRTGKDLEKDDNDSRRQRRTLLPVEADLQKMSQAGDESSSSDEKELEVEKEQPICALAPTVYTRDEGSTDVTSSPAFQCLDEVSCTLVFLVTTMHIVSKSNN